jgi:hypothetical protein
MASKQGAEKQTVKLTCSQCGGRPRNHRVLREHVDKWFDDDAMVGGQNSYQICQCLGCEAIRFRHVVTAEGEEMDENVFPEDSSDSPYKEINWTRFPEDVREIYRETIKALNAGAPILGGGGLRAIVEAICKHRKVPGKNLQDKINQLVKQGLLASTQADLLHEERFLGNKALHELEPPSERELQLGLEIIQGMLNAIYVLPEMAEELKKKRLSSKAPQK